MAFDRRVDGALDGLRHQTSVSRLMVRFSNLGTYSVIWIFIGLVGYTLLPGQRGLLVTFIVAVPVEFALTNGPVKMLFRRPRPAETCVAPSLRRPRTSSFPSGHSSAASMSAIALASTGALGVAAAMVGAGIALSRVFLRLHYASDVIGGLLWGALVGLGVRELSTVL